MKAAVGEGLVEGANIETARGGAGGGEGNEEGDTKEWAWKQKRRRRSLVSGVGEGNARTVSSAKQCRQAVEGEEETECLWEFAARNFLLDPREVRNLARRVYVCVFVCTFVYL